MKKVFATLTVLAMLTFGSTAVMAGEAAAKADAQPTTEVVENGTEAGQQDEGIVENQGAENQNEDKEVKEAKKENAVAALHKTLKTKFIEGGAPFMALTLITLIFGLAFCIERIVYLSLAQINTRKFTEELAQLVAAGKISEAIDKCKNTRGPVAQVSGKAMECLASNDRNDIGTIERTINMEAEVQGTYLEENCSWITLFIAMAPSLGFLGTVIGMVMAFDDIQRAGDISPTVVAGGMKVALITTIFGIIVALVLQVFYNYILSKVESLTSNMEEAAQELLIMCVKSDKCKK